MLSSCCRVSRYTYLMRKLSISGRLGLATCQSLTAELMSQSEMG